MGSIFRPISPLAPFHYRAATKRADEIRREFFGITDPDKALELIRQLSRETEEWIEKDLDPEKIGRCLEPAWLAALDALASVERHLKANPSPERQAMFDAIKQALEAPDYHHGMRVKL